MLKETEYLFRISNALGIGFELENPSFSKLL